MQEDRTDKHSLRNYILGLIAGLAAASFIASPVWRSAIEADRAIEREAAAQQAAYAKTSQITEGCPAPVNGNLRPPTCKSNSEEAVAGAIRGVQDLKAQQVTANWTRTMGIAALVGMIVGVVTLFLLFVTFTETRTAARAGVKANQIAREAMIAQLRPWIKVSCRPGGNAFCSLEDFRIRVYASFFNAGGSVAKNFCYAVHLVEALPKSSDLLVTVQTWFGPEANTFDEVHLFHGEEEGRGCEVELTNPQFTDGSFFVIVAARYQSTFSNEYHYTAIARRIVGAALREAAFPTPAANETRMYEFETMPVENYAGVAI